MLIGLIFIAFVLTISSSSTRTLAQIVEDQKLSSDEVCQITRCRPASTVRLMRKEKYFEVELPQAPIAFQGSINIIAGEKLYIEADDSEDKLSNMKVVDSIDKQNKTILVEFRQEKMKEKEGVWLMTFMINNPYKRMLKFKAGIHPAGKDKFYKTSICPIPPGGSNYETWPYPIVQLVLFDFELVKTDGKQSVRCE